MFQFHPILIPFIFSALVALLLAQASWRQRYRSQARYFTLFMVCILIWVVGFIFEIAATTLDLKIILANLQYIGIDAGPVAFLGLTLSYTGKIKRYKPLVTALYAVPVINQVVIWTDPWHHLFRSTPHLDTTSATFPILVESYNPWFYLFDTPFLYVVFAFSLYQMLETILKARGAFRNQIILLLIGFALMVAIHISYVMGISPIPNFNVTSIPFSLTGGLLYWGMQRYRFLDVMPVARSMLIETLNDLWFVLDRQRRLVDLNPAAGILLGANPDLILGQRLEQVLAKYPALLACLDKGQQGDPVNEISLEINDHSKYFELRLFPLLDRQHKPAGELLILQDITRRVQLEEGHNRAQQALLESRELFSTFMDNLPVPAFIQDHKNKNLYVNHAFEQMFGTAWSNPLSDQANNQLGSLPRNQLDDPSNGQSSGQPEEALASATAKMAFPYSQVLSDKGPQRLEHQIVGTDGVSRVINTTTFAIPRQAKTNLLGGFVHDISELKSIQQNLEVKSSEMERLANIDSLSGLYNRRYFDKALEREAALAEHNTSPLVIGMLDIDHFKMINDSYGHVRGDEVIREVAIRLLDSVRNVDIVGRIGGEEFAILFPRTQIEDAWYVLERLRQRFEQEALTATNVRLTISVGVTTWQLGDNPLQALDRADKLLYQAKQAGRNKIFR